MSEVRKEAGQLKIREIVRRILKKERCRGMPASMCMPSCVPGSPFRPCTGREPGYEARVGLDQVHRSD